MGMLLWVKVLVVFSVNGGMDGEKGKKGRFRV
jgi:hypothetical protein